MIKHFVYLTMVLLLLFQAGYEDIPKIELSRNFKSRTSLSLTSSSLDVAVIIVDVVVVQQQVKKFQSEFQPCCFLHSTVFSPFCDWAIVRVWVCVWECMHEKECMCTCVCVCVCVSVWVGVLCVHMKKKSVVEYACGQREWTRWRKSLLWRQALPRPWLPELVHITCL